MGLQQQYLDFIEASLRASDITHGRMCELGNQRLRGNTGTPGRTGKEYFAPRFDHVSIDLNAEDGALPLDLAHPIVEPDLVGSFDVVTNIGTSEHVYDQYECFANIHRLAKLGGLIIHISPTGTAWPKHERTYSTAFFARLVHAGRYRLVALDGAMTKGMLRRTLAAVAAVKTTEAFVSRPVFTTDIAHDVR